MSDEAQMIANSALEFAQGSGGVARSRTVREQWPQFDQSAWQQIADLGWLALMVPEAHGGLALGAREACVLLESVGRMLLPEPLAASIAAAGLLAECTGDAAQQALAEALAGTRLWLRAADELNTSSFPLRLAHVADCYAGCGLLLAHTGNDGFELRALTTDSTGVTLRPARCVDGSVLAEVTIELSAWSQAAIIAQGPAAQAAWLRAHDATLLGHAAYLVGLMSEALRIAVDYMKLRNQFGVPIGTFQALQHRAASCHVDILASKALVYEACNAFNNDGRARAACAAKARASGAALRVVKECVQFHGAIGFADEHDIGLYFRKAMTISARHGGEMRQNLRYAHLAQRTHPVPVA